MEDLALVDQVFFLLTDGRDYSPLMNCSVLPAARSLY